MRIQHYDLHQGTVTLTVATPRDEAVPSVIFTAATIHEDYAARVRAALREWRHVGDASLSLPSADRLETYLPTGPAGPLYALRELRPAGTSRDVDADYQLEIMRLRYDFVLVDLPGLFAVDPARGEAREFALETALRDLFQAAGLPTAFIPGDSEARNPNRSELDLIVEFAPDESRRGFDIPQP
jgi:hypothetical protein